MKFKKLVLAAALICSTATAQIPVTDGAQIGVHIANQIETIGKWVMQLQQLKQQYDLGKSHYDSIRGARGMGGLLNASGVKIALPANWLNAMNQFKSTGAFTSIRAKYPTKPDYPKYNNVYDTIVVQQLAMDDFYQKTTQRITQVDNLRGQIDSANDPAAKADLQNRLIAEQNAIQASAQLVELIKQKNIQDLDTAAREARVEFRCKEFKRAGC
jgi:type IV secretion system protein VirB5